LVRAVDVDRGLTEREDEQQAQHFYYANPNIPQPLLIEDTEPRLADPSHPPKPVVLRSRQRHRGLIGCQLCFDTLKFIRSFRRSLKALRMKSGRGLNSVLPKAVAA
jgi:hypothetical protein